MNLFSSYSLTGWKAVVVGSILGLLGIACLTYGLGNLQELNPGDRLPLVLVIGVAGGTSLLLSTMLLTCGLRKGPAPRWVDMGSFWMLAVFFAGGGIFLTASCVIDLFSGPGPSRSSPLEVEVIGHLLRGLFALYVDIIALYLVIIGLRRGKFPRS